MSRTQESVAELRAMYRESPKNLTQIESAEAELIKEESVQFVTDTLDIKIEEGLLGATRSSRIQLSGKEKVDFAESFGAVVEHFAMNLEDKYSLSLIDLEDEERMRFYGDLLEDYAFFARSFAYKSRVPFKKVAEATQAQSLSIVNEILEHNDGLKRTKVIEAVKKSPRDPYKNLEIESDVVDEEAVSTLVELNDLRPGSGKVFLLPDDLTTLRDEISTQEEQWKKVVEDMAGSVGQSSESYHDNFGFEQGTREQRMILKKLEELKSIERAAVLIEEPQDVDYVTIGKSVSAIDTVSGEEFTYLIGGYFAAKREDEISYRSPAAQLLLGAEEGEARSGVVGTKQRKIKVLRIS